jgi:hypothetical protein
VIDLDAAERIAHEAVTAAFERLRAERGDTNAPDEALVSADAWITEAEAAEAAGITVDTLRGHRRRGTGPQSRPHRGRVLYRREQVIAWAAVKLSRKGGREAIDGDACDN